MKKLMQMIFSRTALTLTLTIVLGVTFASGVFAATTDIDSLPLAETANAALEMNLVTEGNFTSAGNTAPIGAVPVLLNGTIPVDYAPTVSHRVAGVGADEALVFPYRIVLTGTENIVSFNLYVVDSETREVITATEHLGNIIDGSGGVSVAPSHRGDFIQITPGGNPGGNTRAHLTVLLQHGQEVVITTFIEEHTLGDGGTHWHPPAAAGLGTVGAVSYFWTDGEAPTGFDPSIGFNPGPPDGFGLAHRDYTFSLSNPASPPWNHAPQHFHPAFGPSSEYAEGFVFHSFGHIPTALRDNPPVRIDAIWTFEGELLHSAETTVPITKHLEISAETTAPAITFTFEFDRLSFTDAAGETSSTANMPPIPNREITIPAMVTGSAGIMVSETLANALAGVSFDRPGIFVYRVSEAQTASATPPLSARMDVEFSPAEYDLRIEVRERDNNELFVYSVTITVVEIDEYNSSAPEEGTELEVPPGVLVFTNALTYTPIVEPPLSVETTASLTKHLEISTDTTFTVPNPLLFEFNFEKVSFNSSSDAATLTANMPAVLSPQALNFMPTVSEVATATAMDDAISNVLEGVSFEAAGTFVYRVTEVPNTTNINASPPAYKTMTYSQEVYHLIVTVVDNNGVLEASVRIVMAEDGVEGDDVDGLAFTNVLTYSPGDPPPTCPECGETPPCDICPDCDRLVCRCECKPPPPTCPECGEDPCVCDTGGQETPCPECGNYPCTCTPPPPEACDVCGEDPCVCVTAPQEEDGEETTPPTPTPPRGEGRDPAPAGPKTGDWSNPGLHLMHMLAAMALMMVVAYRLACASEAVVKRKS